ncbi:hypothetical protein [Thermocatellispora tengchongensis]|uniref:hypothetical protein n=1 Tax=Thermocatellispora tengchongensis TaxID=1073253 RepID=UPI003625429D
MNHSPLRNGAAGGGGPPCTWPPLAARAAPAALVVFWSATGDAPHATTVSDANAMAARCLNLILRP